MVVPTLPVIGVTPSIVLFNVLEWLAIAIVYALFGTAVVSTFVVMFPVIVQKHICNNSRTPRQRSHSSYYRCMKIPFLFMGRFLCVHTFPTLFKMHKTRSEHGSQTREFMVFLDRKVESSLALITAFSLIVLGIFSTSAMVFFRYFPVEQSSLRECLEKDNHGRPLFCYRNSDLPVDCANYSTTESRGLHFKCYALALPTGLGIAVAAALGLAKVATVAVTIFVKVTEGYFKMTKKPSRKLQEWCCCKVPRICANKIYMGLSIVLLLALAIVSETFAILYFRHLITEPLLHRLYHVAYMILPGQIYYPLFYVIIYLESHCDKGEYVSFAADQRPLDPRDWDVESGSSVTARQQDEAGTGGESGGTSGVAPNETEDSVLIDTRGNTEYTEFGATQV